MDLSSDTLEHFQRTGWDEVPTPAASDDRASNERDNPAEGAETQKPKAKKRSRVQFSCTACRSRKLKCDRKHPCDRCSRRGEAATCTFVGHGPRVRNSQGGTNPAHIQNRIQHLENLILSFAQKKKLEGDPSAGFEASPESLGQSSSSHQSYQSPNHRSSDDSSAGSPDKKFVDEDVSNWRAILEDIKEVKEYLRENEEESEESDVEPDVDESSRSSFLFGYGRPPSKEELLADLPPPAVADRLIARYFISGDPVLVLLHFPTFQSEYSQFWKNQQDVSPTWLALLFACLARAIAVFYRSGDTLPQPFGDSTAIMNLYRRRSAHCLLLANYTKPGRYKLEALVIYAGLEYATKHSNADTVNIILGFAFKLGFRSGYHRDAKNSPRISAMEGEMRRRTWHLMVQLDTITAFQVGIPRTVQSYQYDTEPPGNYADEDFNETTVQLPEPRPASVFTPSAYLQYKGRIMEAFSRVIDFVSSPKPDSYDQVVELDRYLKGVHESAPPFFRAQSIIQSITDTPDLIMRRYTLEYLYEKSRCILHRKYMTGYEASPQYMYSRWAAVDAAKSILRYQADLFSESQPGGRLHANKWFFNSLQEHDLIMAAMIICVELSQNHSSDTQVQVPYTGRTMVLESREHLSKALETSWEIWKKSLDQSPMGRKAFDALTIMLKKTTGRAPTISGTPAQTNGDVAMTQSVASTNPNHGYDLGGFGYFSPSQVTPATASTDFMQPSTSTMSDFPADLSQQFTSLGPLEGMIEAPNSIDWDALDGQMEGFEARLIDQSWATNVDTDALQNLPTDLSKYWMV